MIKENMFLIYVTFQDCVVNMSDRLRGRGDVSPTPFHLWHSGELVPSHEDWRAALPLMSAASLRTVDQVSHLSRTVESALVVRAHMSLLKYHDLGNASPLT